MQALLDILRTITLEESTRPGERICRRDDELAVILLDRGDTGQFAADGT